jgi:hypothetical protein
VDHALLVGGGQSCRDLHADAQHLQQGQRPGAIEFSCSVPPSMNCITR